MKIGDPQMNLGNNRNGILCILMVLLVLVQGPAASREATLYIAPVVNHDGVLYKVELGLPGKIEQCARFLPSLSVFRIGLAARPKSDEVYEFVYDRIGVVNVATKESRTVAVERVDGWHYTAFFSDDGRWLYAIAALKDMPGLSGLVLDPDSGSILRSVDSNIDTFPDTACILAPDGDLLYAIRGGVRRVSIGEPGEDKVYHYAGDEKFGATDLVPRKGRIYAITYEESHTGLHQLMGDEFKRVGRGRGDPFKNNGIDGRWYFFDKETETVNVLEDKEPPYVASLTQLIGNERFKTYTGSKKLGDEPYRYILDDDELYLDPPKFTDVYLSPDGAFSVFVRDDGIRYPCFLVLRDNKTGTWGDVLSLDVMGGGVTNVVFGDVGP